MAEIERLGFDSVWVRDHVVYRPHPFEDPDSTFLDPFVVLAAAAARSTRLVLGTATLIPYRHPIQSALLIASLSALASGERVIIGWGRGNDAREFTATGASSGRRGALLEEHVAVVRALQQGTAVSHHGEHYSFEDVRIRPPAGSVRFWYGGGTPKAMERTARHFDGLLASRMPASILRQRVDQLRELAAGAGRPPPEVGLVTMVSPAPSIEAGLAPFDVERIGADTERRFPEQPWHERDGFDGVLVVGPAENTIGQIKAFEEAGVDHFIIDLRARFADWETVTAELAETVLPAFWR